MREILFRGKRLDSGEWVEGNLVVKKDPFLEIDYCFILAQGKGDSFVTWHKVDPATVGQYTGLTDKNGKRIFEGDIMRYERRKPPYLVCYSPELAQFLARPSAGIRIAPCMNVGTMTECEVIGNIHDNQELMGGDGNG